MPAAASALGVVAETPAELGERLARATRGAQALLVLDGFERFLADAAQVAQLLAAAPNLTVLATSRAPLRLTVEHAYRVEPLAASNAAALFKARATATRPDWAPRRRSASSPRSARGSTGCRWRSSSPPTAPACCRCRRCWSASSGGWSCLSYGPRDLPVRQQSLRATLRVVVGGAARPSSARCSRS